MEDLLNGYFLQVLTFVCINIILAMTIYMTLCTGILSLGNAGLMSFGAYTSAILTAQYHVPMPVGIFSLAVSWRFLWLWLSDCRRSVSAGCIWRLPRWGSVKWSESSP